MKRTETTGTADRHSLRSCGMTLVAFALFVLLGARPALGQATWEHRSDSALVVRVLDVGQGDAILIENGGSVVLVDGGPNPKALGRYLDEYHLNGDTIAAVILSHAHGDH